MVGDSLLHIGRSAALRVVACVMLVTTLFASVQPARAGVDWCSGDPVFAFRHGGLLSTYGLDVQVMVPLSELPLREPVQVKVVTPENVATEVVNPPNPAFPIDVKVAASAKATKEARYTAELVVVVPESDSGFPVRLVISDPQTLSVTVIEGTAGSRVRASVAVGR